MANAMEGRWWLDFTHRTPRNPAGNELILDDGAVTIAVTGVSAGSYQIEPALLTITLSMPAIPDEGPWRMEAKLVLLDPADPPELLSGIVQAIDSKGRVIANSACALVRRPGQA
ncbi:hypothetical protein HL653_12320 [Sphingomonas sp. AP4-R1]|uniref:hypothetical protein n=1 Tax=Sphingomonas sp. AP4-R1 TaxID=2735134 RepID=UPI001493A84F|nr:hypothetical protein [Sphingomonas sp. AP4-R1]QJU58450.1 hypothetical protein HL653_12320 [Sphingomonas sp. AP4-R1]